MHVDLMGISRWLGAALGLWLAYGAITGDNDFRKRWPFASSEESAADANSSARFEQVVMPSRLPADTVWIFAHRDCPTPDRKRAETLAAELQRLGIPHVYEDQASFTGLDQQTQESPEWQQTRRLLESGSYPVVMLDGVGKANPELNEVIAEYRRFR
jgi:hypothetical protein